MTQQTPVELALIVAADENGLIGANGGMPWHIPGDLKFFKQTTLNKPILMGRKTYDSIGRALPKRRNLVLTRRSDFTAEGCERVASLDEAIGLAGEMAAPQLMIIGGTQVFKLALPRAQRLFLTRIHETYEGDTWLPEIDWTQWRKVSSKRVSFDNAPDCTFMEWERQTQA